VTCSCVAATSRNWKDKEPVASHSHKGQVDNFEVASPNLDDMNIPLPAVHSDTHHLPLESHSPRQIKNLQLHSCSKSLVDFAPEECFAYQGVALVVMMVGRYWKQPVVAAAAVAVAYRRFLPILCHRQGILKGVLQWLSRIVGLRPRTIVRQGAKIHVLFCRAYIGCNIYFCY